MTRLPLAIVLVVFASALAAWSPPATADSHATYTVSGKVVDDQGKPIEGAFVHGGSYAPDGRVSEDKNVTGPDGAFTLHLGAGKGWMNARVEGWPEAAHRDLQIDGNETGVTLTIKAPPPKTATVQGRVLDAEGKPVEGALVRLDQGCCFAYDGGYGYPESGATTPPSEGSGGGSTGSSSGGASADDPSTSGTTATTSVAPSPPMRIMPTPCCYDAGQETRTGADGAYSFKTYAGPRQLTASAPGYAHATVQVEAKDGQTVTKDLKLVKVPDADAVVKGRIVDARTGLPVANAQVTLVNHEWSRYENALTGADGAYTLRSLPGWSQISVNVYGWAVPVPLAIEEGAATTDVATTDAAMPAIVKPSPIGGPEQDYYQHVQTFRAKSGETTIDVKLEPKPQPKVVLQGYVVDPETKKGVPDAQVSVWNQDTGDWGSATTDTTGSYKIMVRPGHYTANVWANGHLPGAATFVIGEDETLKRVDVQAPKGETRWAPCDDCDAEIAYATRSEASVTMGATKGGGDDYASSGAPGAAPMAPPVPVAQREAGLGESPATMSSTARGSAYAGGPGGLPPYNPNEAPAAEEGVKAAGETDRNTVPGAGLVLGLAAVGVALAAFAGLRRRG